MSYSRGKRHVLLDQHIEVGFLLNTSLALVEIFIGIATGSLALIADAGHNLTDSISMIVSFVARRVAEREPNERKTYGYGRVNILAAAVNSFLLIGISGYVLFEAYDRFTHPHLVSGLAIAWVSGFGIAINLIIVALLYRDRKDLNIQSLYMNMALDALALVGTFVAGILMEVTHNPIFDPMVGLIIGGMLLVSAWEMIWATVHIFLESVPAEVDYYKVYKAIKAMSFVRGVDDLHIWTISSDLLSLSCHVQLRATTYVKTSEKRVAEIEAMLARKFKIKHVTIQVEDEPCRIDEVHNTDDILE